MNSPLPKDAAAAAAGSAGVAPRNEQQSALVLLSGGLDSATAAAWAAHAGYRLSALSVDYGQRHRCELDSARAVAQALGIRDHVVLPIDLAAFGSSALVDLDIPVPQGRSGDQIATGIPVTYVPARNTVFLSLALAMAEARGCDAIVLGINAVDYSGYPDCRPEFLRAFAEVARLGTKAGVEGRPIQLLAPLIALSKTEIIRLGLSLGVDYGLTTSCYTPNAAGRQCGRCDSCLIRAAGFAAAGVNDPREG